MKFFKIASVITLSIFAFVLFSCENEPLDSDFEIGNGENPFNPSNNLIGTWTLENFNLSVISTTEVAGVPFESTTLVESENENYDVTFNASTFTTSGSYGYVVDITVAGQSNMQNLSVQNVSGVGNYTTNGSEITSDASFVSFEFQGMDLSEFQGEQTAPYTISADGQTLTFTQSTTETTSEGGSTSTSVVNSISVWTKVSDGNDSCTEASDFATSAETAYNNDNTNVDLCNAYTSALQNQITACGDASGELQAIIDGLGDCANSLASIIGTWEETAFTSNGEELDDICIGDIETYTATTYHYSEVWGDNCENLEDSGDPEPYTLVGNQLTITEEGDSYVYEVLELTDTTLKYQDVYSESGINYVDIYTFTKQ